MRLSRLNILASFVLAAVLYAPAWAANTALPGTLNYVEGKAAIGADELDSKAIGTAELQPGQSLNTENGKAEILLMPGVFLRVGQNSSVTMQSPSLTDTRVVVDRGEAMVDVDELHEQNNIQIIEHGATTRVLKTGVYDFDANQNLLRVFAGEARVQDGDEHATVKSGHQVALNGTGQMKSAKFDKNQFEQSDLYRWSNLRSSYLAEANMDAARTYVVNGWYGPGWIGAGWYWNPWFSSYTFIPGGGSLYSPFGWGFYSPLVAYRAPLFYGGGYYRHFGPAYRAPTFARSAQFAPHGYPHAPAVRGGSSAGGGFRGSSSGGMHGGFARR